MTTATTAGRAAPSLLGEVHCLNCGRILAEVIKRQADERHLLRRAARQATINVKLIGSHSLQCTHCGGRAMVQPFEEPREAHVRQPAPALVAAAS